MRLTPAQVTLLKVELDRFQGNVASRSTNYHIAMEEFVEAVLKIVLPPVPVQHRDPEAIGDSSRLPSGK